MRQTRQRSRFEGELQRTLSAMQKQSFEKRTERVEQASGHRRKLPPAPFSIRKLHLPHPNTWLRGWPSSQAIIKPRLGPMLDCVPGVFEIARSSTGINFHIRLLRLGLRLADARRRTGGGI